MARNLRSGLAALLTALMIATAGVAIAPSAVANELAQGAVGDRKLEVVPSTESLADQCGQLIQTFEDSRTLGERFRDQDPSATMLAEVSQALSQFSGQVSQVQVADVRLQGYRDRFVELYRLLSGAANQLSSALVGMERIQQQPVEERDTPELVTLINQVQQANHINEKVAEQERALVTELNSYCRPQE